MPPFKLSENPSIDEKYFYWYFSDSLKPIDIILKAILVIPTVLFFSCFTV
jgi:hypothetical protein